MPTSGDVCGCYLCASDIDNWPSGTDEDDQLKLINKVEAIINKATQNMWCAVDFDIKVNGNGKNRIFPPVKYDIITITSLLVDCVELDPSWYEYDENSIYLTPCTSGSSLLSPELYYKLAEVVDGGLFPRGYNNIQIKGTWGEIAPQPIIQAATMYAKGENDPSLYTYSGLKKSEKIGRYSYTNIAGSTTEVLTGVMEVDVILNLFLKGKSIIMTP